MAPQYGPHRWSAGYHDDGTNEALRGATFLVKDLAGARFVDCDLTGVKWSTAAWSTSTSRATSSGSWSTAST